jgi:hypothetical protein
MRVDPRALLLWGAKSKGRCDREARIIGGLVIGRLKQSYLPLDGGGLSRGELRIPSPLRGEGWWFDKLTIKAGVRVEEAVTLPQPLPSREGR